MHKPIVIHNGNIDYRDFEQISFDTEENVDESIVKLLSDIDKDYQYDAIVIKDSLSANYLDFYGLLLAHHVRLSENFNGKGFPIIIVSDLDIWQLNKLTPLARILFSKGIYLTNNGFDSFNDLLNKDLLTIDEKIIREDFLTKLSIEPPSNYDSNHSISNEWSIYQWSKALKDVDDIVNNTDNMLYFKYLKTKYPVQKTHQFSTEKLADYVDEKVLYIDDEWQKGWSEILKNILKLGQNFQCLESINKEMSKEEIKELVIKEVNSEFDPDVVLLDLRLHDSDFTESDPKKLTGIELLKSIKEINQGIQVIIFTASEKSLILEEALSSGALGYIKKEHPESYNISTEDNISNLISRVSEGFERKFLKNIWNTRNNILDNLNNKSFLQYITKKDVNKKLFDVLKNEANFVFDILNSETKNKNNYAAISMVTWLDALQQIFMSEKQKIYYFWDGTDVEDFGSLSKKTLSLIKQKMNYLEINNFESQLTKYVETKRNQYAHSNPNYKLITSEELEEFYNLLFEVLNMIINPKEPVIEEKKIPKPVNPNSKLKIKKKKSLD